MVYRILNIVLIWMVFTITGFANNTPGPTLLSPANNSNYIQTNKLQLSWLKIVLNYNNDRANVTFPGAMEHLCGDDITEEKLKYAKHMHMSSPFLQPRIHKDLINIFKRAKKFGLTTSLDPQWDPNEKWELDIEN